MALRTPPSWLQNGSHPAENDRLTVQAQYATTGTIGSGSLAITAQASPNMTVNAAAGWCAILGSTASSGVYTAYNDATTVLTITTASLTLPRIDRIVVTVSDSAYSGSTNTVAFQVLAGTPAASPSAPATPSNSISLATIAVAANATSITSGNITDTRTAVTSNAFLLLTGGTVTGATTFSGATTISGTTALSGATTLSNTTTLSGTTTISGATTVTNTISSNTTITAASFTPSAGTTTVAPLKFTSGTNLTTPQDGVFEYDGTAAYFTPEATSAKRGLFGADYYYLLGTQNNLTSSTTAQSMFGVGLTLPTGRYEFEIYAIIASGTTAHNTQFLIAGTSTHAGSWHSVGIQNTAAAPYMVYGSSNGAATSLFSGTSTASSTSLLIRGSELITAAGTWIPQVQFTAAPGGTNNVGVTSYVRVRRVGIVSGSNNVSVGNWA